MAIQGGLGEQIENHFTVHCGLEHHALDSSSSRSAAALVRLPLWATEIWPRMQLPVSGCALRMLLEPVVE